MLIKNFLNDRNIVFPSDNPQMMRRVIGYDRSSLPHISFDNGLYFVTTRLSDSVPEYLIQKKRIELGIPELTAVDTKQDTPELYDKFKLLWKYIQDYEDQGMGECLLAVPEIASLVMTALQFYDKKYYELLAWSIMPNHIHILIKLLENMNAKGKSLLGECMRRLKSYTASQANKLLERQGTPFWQKEYFDRYIRNENHLRNVVKYILNNPRKAGYTKAYTGTVFDDWKTTIK